jgi:hypothetical protein
MQGGADALTTGLLGIVQRTIVGGLSEMAASLAVSLVESSEGSQRSRK